MMGGGFADELANIEQDLNMTRRLVVFDDVGDTVLSIYRNTGIPFISLQQYNVIPADGDLLSFLNT